MLIITFDGGFMNQLQLRLKKNVSWTIVSTDIFIFNEINGKIHVYSGVYKDFLEQICHEKNVKKMIETSPHLLDFSTKLIELNLLEYEDVEGSSQ